MCDLIKVGNMVCFYCNFGYIYNQQHNIVIFKTFVHVRYHAYMYAIDFCCKVLSKIVIICLNMY